MSKKVIFLIVFVVVAASVVFIGIFGGAIDSLHDTVISEAVSVKKVEVINNNVATEKDIKTKEDASRYAIIPKGTVRIRIYWEVLPLDTTDKSVTVTSTNPDVAISFKLDSDGKQLYCEIEFLSGAQKATYLTVTCKDRTNHFEIFEIRVSVDNIGGEG